MKILKTIKKSIALALLASLLVGASFAQVITNNGVTATMSSGLVISGGVLNNVSGTITNNGTMILNSDITNGGTINGNGTFNIGGNWTNNGTFTSGSSLVNFNGSNAQTISGSSSSEFNNLTLNNSNGLVLSLDAVVNGTLTFSNGIITTGANTLNLGNSATVAGAGAGNYVFGNLAKGIAAIANLSKTFEVGDATVYAPVQLDFAGTPNGTGKIIVNTTQGQHPNINTSLLNPAKDVNRFWSLTNSGVNSFTSFNATFSFVANDILGSANTANFHVKQWNGSAWYSTTDGNKTISTTQATGLNSFGSFVLGENCITPVVNIVNNNGTSILTCNTTSISLTATGGNLYLWDNGTTNANRTVNTAGVYSVTVTNTSGGCTASGSTNITYSPDPTPVISKTETSGLTANDGIICNGATVLLDAGVYTS